jgi:hypothetical protein
VFRLLLSVALAAGVAAGATPNGPKATTAPSLRLVTLTPLTLRGTGFRARERVRVTLTIRTRAQRSTLKAGARGAFTYRPATFVVVDPCRGTIVVTAVGISSARKATWKRACRPPDVWPASVGARRTA